MDHLWSPWRMTYLRRSQEQTGGAGCIFCDKPAQDRDAENLIVHRGEKAFVILNLYPYNNGHLMIVPYAHAASLEQLDTPTLTEIMLLTNQSLAALRAVYNPHAFNLGVNIGAAAGAGIAEHVHQHVVPRWAGDSNYMSTVAETRVIPEDLQETYQRVREAWPKLNDG
jgi:ATP adenylyltransferase